MSEIGSINQVLQQMQVMKAKAEGGANIQQAATNNLTFPTMLKDAISQVNDLQMHSAHMKKQFEKGDPSVSLSDVMIASQKAGLAFDATLQVRNKLIQAYQDIMNMPI